MAKYIDADALLKSIDGNPYVTDSIKVYIRCCVRKAPAADVAEVVHGVWIKKCGYYGDDYYTCSACGEDFCTIEWSPEENGMKFCPNCGARMG